MINASYFKHLFEFKSKKSKSLSLDSKEEFGSHV